MPREEPGASAPGTIPLRVAPAGEGGTAMSDFRQIPARPRVTMAS